MKIKINKNILWTEAFSRELSEIGVKYACISPGSRNTPLTLAFANNKKIKTFIHIDERSSGFFALGIAKATGSPVVLVCTSGTATAEFYPAIIEAYQHRIPLIVCTADRPPELRNRGANQTINQNNLYKNHIRWFFDVGLPKTDLKSITHIKSAAEKAVYNSCIKSRGPVHLNFPFRKPFEPDSYTDEISKSLNNFALTPLSSTEKVFAKKEKSISKQKWFTEVLNIVKKKRKGIIVAGPENFTPQFAEYCQKLSLRLGYPVFADGASQLRFGSHDKQNIISNFEGFLRSKCFSDKYKPEIILQFGRTITSKALDEYLNKCTAARYIVNDYGDCFDPSGKAKAALAYEPGLFCKSLLAAADKYKVPAPDSDWTNKFIKAEEISDKVRDKIISKAKFPAESCIPEEVLNIIPDGTKIMMSNSMPVRDFDYFAPKIRKEITVFNNRGASGIDGITSTALGIASSGNSPTVLITGDLAFYYDLNGLLAAAKYSIPLVVILVNNNGGGIFEVLPISDYGKTFKEFFITPHNLNFAAFVKAYNGSYYNAKNEAGFRKALKSAITAKKLTVIEIKTNAVKSLAIRRKFWAAVNSTLEQDKSL